MNAYRPRRVYRPVQCAGVFQLKDPWMNYDKTGIDIMSLEAIPNVFCNLM
jgi:hypothetical protein